MSHSKHFFLVNPELQSVHLRGRQAERAVGFGESLGR